MKPILGLLAVLGVLGTLALTSWEGWVPSSFGPPVTLTLPPAAPAPAAEPAPATPSEPAAPAAPEKIIEAPAPAETPLAKLAARLQKLGPRKLEIVREGEDAPPAEESEDEDDDDSGEPDEVDILAFGQSQPSILRARPAEPADPLGLLTPDRPARAALPPAPEAHVLLAAGTRLPVRLTTTLSSDRNRSGDTFLASLDEEVVVDNMVIAGRGARVEGRVYGTRLAGRVHGLSALTLVLTQMVTPEGRRVEIATEPLVQSGPGSKAADAARIAGVAALGAVLGAIAGGGDGAATGAMLGGAAGAGGVVVTRGKPVTVPSETRLTFRLRQAVAVPEPPDRQNRGWKLPSGVGYR